MVPSASRDRDASKLTGSPVWTDMFVAARVAAGPPGCWLENSIGIRIRSRSRPWEQPARLKRVKKRYGRCPIVSKLRLLLTGSRSDGSRTNGGSLHCQVHGSSAFIRSLPAVQL